VKDAIEIVSFLSLFFVALAIAPAAAHLLELSNKINLSPEDYLTVQQIYRDLALLRFVVAGALVSTLVFTIMVFTIMVRRQPKAFAFALIALLCICTFPPENLQALRAQWDYSHAAGVGLNLIALRLDCVRRVAGRQAQPRVITTVHAISSRVDFKVGAAF
jgi:hypothetical protein